MLEKGIDPEVVRLTTWQNAIDAYAQSGQIDVEALEGSLKVDNGHSLAIAPSCAAKSRGWIRR